jgi:hypothetical protein
MWEMLIIMVVIVGLLIICEFQDCKMIRDWLGDEEEEG